MKLVNIVGPSLVLRGFYDFLVYNEWNSKYRCHAFLNDPLKMGTVDRPLQKIFGFHYDPQAGIE